MDGISPKDHARIGYKKSTVYSSINKLRSKGYKIITKNSVDGTDNNWGTGSVYRFA
jgi:hypothetical protein